MVKWHQFWHGKFKGELPEHAYEQKPDLDYPLQEALSGFYFLSERRMMAVGMSTVIPYAIPLSEIREYYQIFKPYLPLDHFVRVVNSADRAYLTLLNENNKKTIKSPSKKTKR